MMVLMGEAVVGRTDYKTHAESLARVRGGRGGRRARPADQASRACVAVRTRVVAGKSRRTTPVSREPIGGAEWDYAALGPVPGFVARK